MFYHNKNNNNKKKTPHLTYTIRKGPSCMRGVWRHYKGCLESRNVFSGQGKSVGQVRTSQVRTGQVRTGQVWTGQVKAGQVRTGLARTCPVKTGL